MSDQVLTVLIVTVAVLVVLYLFRRQLRRFVFKVNEGGIHAELETHDPTRASDGPRQPAMPSKGGSVNIIRNRQIGKGNVIEVGRDNVNVDDNTQLGQDQKIVARPDKAPEKKR